MQKCRSYRKQTFKQLKQLVLKKSLNVQLHHSEGGFYFLGENITLTESEWRIGGMATRRRHSVKRGAKKQEAKWRHGWKKNESCIFRDMWSLKCWT